MRKTYRSHIHDNLNIAHARIRFIVHQKIDMQQCEQGAYSALVPHNGIKLVIDRNGE